MGRDNVNHQVLEKGIDNMFIAVDSPFRYEERKEGSRGWILMVHTQVWAQVNE
jgi:hypothetical protein